MGFDSIGQQRQRFFCFFFHLVLLMAWMRHTDVTQTVEIRRKQKGTLQNPRETELKDKFNLNLRNH